mmetsp:Transcript_27474/g.45209  ORF Transcript_27474/g.45209 Transcript_27474/m.45209 type:complete len:231 (+) Transcript_27474:325-1017(+)
MFDIAIEFIHCHRICFPNMRFIAMFTQQSFKHVLSFICTSRRRRMVMYDIFPAGHQRIDIFIFKPRKFLNQRHMLHFDRQTLNAAFQQITRFIQMGATSRICKTLIQERAKMDIHVCVGAEFMQHFSVIFMAQRILLVLLAHAHKLRVHLLLIVAAQCALKHLNECRFRAVQHLEIHPRNPHVQSLFIDRDIDFVQRALNELSRFDNVLLAQIKRNILNPNNTRIGRRNQ